VDELAHLWNSISTAQTRLEYCAYQKPGLEGRMKQHRQIHHVLEKKLASSTESCSAGTPTSTGTSTESTPATAAKTATASSRCSTESRHVVCCGVCFRFAEFELVGSFKVREERILDGRAANRGHVVPGSTLKVSQSSTPLCSASGL
jgi:hypothetical protein